MNIQMPQPMQLPLPLLIGGVVALLISTAAMTYASVADWTPVSARAMTVQAAAPDAIEAQADATTRCVECGVIESVRPAVPVGSTLAMYAITVRMGDGSTQVVNDSSPATWRPGERMILIAGRDQTGK